MATAAHLISNTLPSVKQLQCFLAVAHELNFRRAAERLSMTQPPLTRHIQSLEALLHQQLRGLGHLRERFDGHGLPRSLHPLLGGHWIARLDEKAGYSVNGGVNFP